MIGARGGHVVFMGLLLLAGCDDARPDQWDAYIYPDLNNEARNEVVKGFKSFELCQSASLKKREALHANEGSYECGHRCGPNPRLGGMYLCEETRN